MDWVRIDNDIFDIEDITIQTSIGTHATIYITLDINSNPTYHKYFIKLYENQNHQTIKKFKITSSRFVGIGSVIKSIDTDFDNKMNLSILCDILDVTDVQSRRDELLNDLLNDETLVNKKNIK
jgi:hypothetical protein